MTTVIAAWAALNVGFLFGALWAGLAHANDKAPRNVPADALTAAHH